MIKIIKNFFNCVLWPWNWFNGEFDPITEGHMAHEYVDIKEREEITHRYNEYYHNPATPLVNPERFDPLNPPKGWAWDPYYHIWLMRKEKK